MTGHQWCVQNQNRTVSPGHTHYRITPCTALAINDERGCMARLCVIKVRSHHAAPMPITLAESSMTDRLQAGRSGLQMSSCPGTVIPRWRTSSSSRVRVSKVSTFRYVSWTVHSPYLTLNLRRPSFYGRRPLYGSGTVFCSISHLLRHFLSSALVWRRTSLNSVIHNYGTAVVPTKWHCHFYGQVNRSIYTGRANKNRTLCFSLFNKNWLMQCVE